MRLLLDTRVFLWWLSDAPSLESSARSLLSDPRNLVHVSAASVWEAAIKRALGRLELDAEVDLADHIAPEGFSELALTAAHASSAARLPHHHADPFDRMLVAQAIAEHLTLVTTDATILGSDEVDTLAV